MFEMVIASEAKQSMAQQPMELSWIASLAMTGTKLFAKGN